MAAKREWFTDLPVHDWDLERTSGFDIVHSHGIAGFQNWRIRAKARRPKIVHSYYGTILGIQVALRWFQNLVGWNGLNVPRNIVRESLGGLAADAVIANSPKVLSEIRRFYGIRKNKTFVVPGGHSRRTGDVPKEILRQLFGFPESAFLFLFVGRADPVKNFSAALAAFQLTKAIFPNTYLILAPKQDSESTEGIIGVELEPQKMNLLYRAADALIHPSHYEAYSLAVHEALANGLPVIVSRNTGNADYCTDGADALILPRCRGGGLIRSMSEMMCFLIESHDLRSALGKAASAKFGAMDWDWVASETERVYSSL